ncbi:hypothetical protein BDA99DRAFT_553381 [Phascolomyces articulosus]|uniref:Uncharacterized protein n=1 Tax=Phascolomyces articulosus TaxID=60185 RepID=A0AAD5K0B3_9FUNG|nr:hypothetical protein BDA99DRAFT_553381 [Phascolomyces articulosus]
MGNELYYYYRDTFFIDTCAINTTDFNKFLTFLPHSGLHNQRIALINAAILAGALNRTLLMPELNLGSATYWRPFEQLMDRLAHCPGNPNEPNTRCYEYRDYVPVPVDTIFDLTPLHELGIRTMQRHDMHDDYFSRYWGIDEDIKEDVMYTLDDQTRYSYQIHDDLSVPNATLDQFETRVDLQDLAARKEPFIMFGSLFGSRRLAIQRTDLVHIRDYLRQRIGVKHPVALEKAGEIINRLGGADNYLSVHLRQGDGRFKKEAKKTIEQIRQSMEKYAKKQSGHHDDDEDDVVKGIQRIQDRSERLEACVATQEKHKHTRLRLIYMATDTKNPHENFTDLYDEFVCLFTLNDFPQVVQSIRSTIVEVDPYLRNGDLLLPLVDGEVAAKADHFIPTPKSTFSGYIRQRNTQFHELT